MKRAMSDAVDTSSALERVRIVAVDGEWRGNNALSNGILALGWVIGRADRCEIVHKERINFGPLEYVSAKQTNDLANEDCVKPVGPFLNTQDYEPRCLDEFWSKHLEQKATFELNPTDPMLAIAMFKNMLDELEEKCFTVILISDAPGCDFHYINTYLDHAGLPSINTTIAGKYRQVYSTEDYARGALGMGYDHPHLRDQDLIDALEIPVVRGDHDHMPENDAEYIYNLHWHTIQKTRKKKKKKIPITTISVPQYHQGSLREINNRGHFDMPCSFCGVSCVYNSLKSGRYFVIEGQWMVGAKWKDLTPVQQASLDRYDWSDTMDHIFCCYVCYTDHAIGPYGHAPNHVLFLDGGDIFDGSAEFVIASTSRMND